MNTDTPRDRQPKETISAAKAQEVFARADQLFTAEQVAFVLDRMAKEISHQVAGKNPILLCVMKGGIVLTSELLLKLDFPLRLDYLHASRYRDQTSGEELNWKTRPELPLKGETVIVVDDILDEGYTLAAVLAHCREASAEMLVSAVLAHKIHDRGLSLRADVTGLEVPDRYVFGFGMDYKGYWRNAGGIYAAADQDAR